MKTNTIQLMTWLTLALGATVSAQVYTITRSTIDAGGHVSATGGSYECLATVGQPDAGALEGGNVVLTGGFWFGTLAVDLNGDGLVGAGEYQQFSACFTGPDSDDVAAECLQFDLDDNGRIDLADAAGFQTIYTGS